MFSSNVSQRLKCDSCHKDFIFMGYTNIAKDDTQYYGVPKKCPDCRIIEKDSMPKKITSIEEAMNVLNEIKNLLNSSKTESKQIKKRY